MTFFSVTLRKKTGNVDLKIRPKIWTPFWGPRKEKTIRRTPKRGPNFAPHFRVHIAHVFRSVTPEKITCCVECLWAGSLSWQPHVLALPAMWCEENEPAHKHPTRGWPFSASRREKKTGNVDLKMGPKIWTPFWGPRKEKTIRRTPKRGPNFAPHFRVHIAHVFRSVTPEKITCCVECLWAGSFSWQPHVLALPAMWCEENEPAHKHPTRGWPFSASRCEKKTGNVDLKMGPKIWTPFWGPRKEKTIRRTPKRGPNFAPHFRVHIAHVFRSVTPEKITCCVECLWAGSLSWQPHVLAQFQQCGVKKTNLLTSILLGDDLFQRHAAKKKRAMWTSKWGLKSGPRFGGRERKRQFGGPQNGVQILHPILGSTLPMFFVVWRRKKSHVV